MKNYNAETIALPLINKNITYITNELQILQEILFYKFAKHYVKVLR